MTIRYDGPSAIKINVKVTRLCQAVALKYGTDNNVAELKEPQNVLFYDMVCDS